MPRDDPGLPHPLPCMLHHAQPNIVIQDRKPVIWVLGGPGIGKGVQSILMSKRYGFTHISTGEMLRAEVKGGSNRSTFLQNTMTKGNLLPDEIQLKLISDEMKKTEATTNGFLIDGYPRNRQQGLDFELTIRPVSVLINLETCPETMLARLKNRMAHSTALRLDDNLDAFTIRIDSFLENNQGILDEYMDKLITINAEGTIEEVFTDVKLALDPIMKRANIPIYESS